MLLPKEHGAYFQLAVPAATALAMGRPTLSAVLFVVSAAAAFLGHESLLVVMGARGAAMKRQAGARAARSLAAFAVVAIGAGVLAWSRSRAVVGGVPGIPVAMVAALGLLIILHRGRSALGELVAAAALTSVALPIAYASGVAPTHAWGAWVTWLVVMGAGTCAVRTIIAAKKGAITLGARIVNAGLLVATAWTLTSQWAWTAFAAAPAVGLCVALTLLPPHPRFLRRVGWSLAAATMFAAVMLVVQVRRQKDASTPTTPALFLHSFFS